MNDLELTKLCAMTMGLKIVYPNQDDLPLCVEGPLGSSMYSPLKDDMQAMALVKKLGLTIDPAEDVAPFTWRVCVSASGDWEEQIYAEGADLNRAIVECAAKLGGSKPQEEK